MDKEKEIKEKLVENSVYLRDPASLIAAAINRRREVLVTGSLRDEDRTNNRITHKVWTYNYENAIPLEDHSFFIYLKNTGVNPIELIGSTISSSVAGTLESYVHIHSVVGEPEYKQSDELIPTNRNLGFKNKPSVSVIKTNHIQGLTDLGILESLHLNRTFDSKEFPLKPAIVIPAESAVAFMWGANSGALSGTITISEME